MARRPLNCAASLAVMAALTFVGTERTTAAEQSVDGMRVVSSDQASHFVALALNKSIVIDLPKDVAEALVANPKIVNAVVRSKRRVYIIGDGIGQTNVYFYGDDGRQIGALDVYVAPTTPPANSMSASDAYYVVVYRGAEGKYTTQNCSRSACVAPVDLQNR
jgi:pilus assembly protein CpaC